MATNVTKKTLTSGIILLIFGLSACSVPKSVKLEQLKNQYEELGRVSARAMQCNISVPQPNQELSIHAKKNGASDDEVESLVSYHDAAMVEAQKTNTPCSPNEKISVQQQLDAKLKELQ